MRNCAKTSDYAPEETGPRLSRYTNQRVSVDAERHRAPPWQSARAGQGQTVTTTTARPRNRAAGRAEPCTMPRHGMGFPRQASGLVHGVAHGVRNAFKSRAEQRDADRRRVDACIEELLSVVDAPPGTEVNLAEGELMCSPETPGRRCLPS